MEHRPHHLAGLATKSHGVCQDLPLIFIQKRKLCDSNGLLLGAPGVPPRHSTGVTDGSLGPLVWTKTVCEQDKSRCFIGEIMVNHRTKWATYAGAM